MKKFLLLLTLLLNILYPVAWANMDRLVEMLNNAQPGDAFFLDLDQTTFIPHRSFGYFGSEYWFRYKAISFAGKHLTNTGAGFHAYADMWMDIQSKISVEAMDERLPLAIKNAQTKGAQVFGLTARPYEMSDITDRQLKDIDIQFDRIINTDQRISIESITHSNDKTNKTYQPYISKNGVVFSGPGNNYHNQKGNVLFALLEQFPKLDAKIKRIIFADNSYTNLQYVARAAENHNQRDRFKIILIEEDPSIPVKYSDTWSKQELLYAGTGKILQPKSLNGRNLKVQETMSITQLIKSAQKGELIILDLDNTVFKSSELLGGDDWFEHFFVQTYIERTKGKILTEIEKQNIRDEIGSIWESMQKDVKVKLVEKELARLIAEAQARGAHIIAATARSYKVEDATMAQLKSLGIKLTQLPQIENPIIKHDPLAMKGFQNIYEPFYKNGVIFTGPHRRPYNDKGKVILEYFNRIGTNLKDYTKVTFVDDKYKNILKVARAFAAEKINYQALLLKRTHHRKLLVDRIWDFLVKSYKHYAKTGEILSSRSSICRDLLQ